MTPITIFLLIIIIVLVMLLFWSLVLSWIKRKSKSLKEEFMLFCQQSGEKIVIEPQACLYRGSDFKFGNVKGNGVICLTDKSIIFEKLTGQRIIIQRSDIEKVSEEKWFKGKASYGTGAKYHLVIHTGDDNKVGFLMRDTEAWKSQLNK